MDTLVVAIVDEIDQRGRNGVRGAAEGRADGE